MKAFLLVLGTKGTENERVKVQFSDSWTKKEWPQPTNCLQIFFPHVLPYSHTAFVKCPLQKPQEASPITQGQCRVERTALNGRWEDIWGRFSSGMWNAAVQCLSWCGEMVANIKRQCICSTNLNAEMVPALKNKSIMDQSNEEMCVNRNYSLWFHEDSEILMPCHLLQRRLYNPDSFWCHKMHPIV